MNIKAITIWQPWGSAIAIEAKGYETRGWATSYRGPIAIHAAKRPYMNIIKTLPADTRRILQQLLNYEGEALPTGAVICTAELVNVWHIVYNPGTDVDVAKNIPIGAESMSKDKHAPDFHDYIVPTAQEFALGDWTPGRYAWELRNIKLLPEPIPAKGQQGLWNWEPPEEVLA